MVLAYRASLIGPSQCQGQTGGALQFVESVKMAWLDYHLPLGGFGTPAISDLVPGTPMAFMVEVIKGMGIKKLDIVASLSCSRALLRLCICSRISIFSPKSPMHLNLETSIVKFGIKPSLSLQRS